MLTDATLRSAVEALWDKLWSGGLANPLDAIEQLSFLLFLKRLDEREQDAERGAKLRGKKFIPIFTSPDLRWSHWTQLPADKALKQVKEKVFPFIKSLGGAGGSFAAQMENAEFKINKPSLLVETCRAIDAMQISAQNQDVQGDIYEYLLGKLNTAGQNGQFRTPRHIIRMMVQMRDPRPGERICDPAAGTCGFLVNAWEHLLETHTDPRDIKYDEEGYPHGLTGSRLTKDEYEFSQTKALTGFDSDSGMTMLRIGSMNLMLHGIAAPNFRYTDALSKAFIEEQSYDAVLANPPFKGAIDAADVNPTLPVRCRKTEILFLHLFLRLLENGGRAAVIVPDGILFGSSNAHVDIRKKIIEENCLDAVVSMPSGVFRPYAGVSTAVLLFTKGGSTDRVWFYDMEHDGYSLDDKRQKVAANDIPDVLNCWNHRTDTKFQQKRTQRLADLQTRIAPLKKDRLEHHATIHRLKFEEVISKDADKARAAREKAEAELAELQARMTPLQTEINQLTRQFWVTKDKIKSSRYDLSASRYRLVEQDEEFHEKPHVTLERLLQLEAVVAGGGHGAGQDDEVSGIPSVALDELMASKLGSVNPARFPDEAFDLYSVPAFDNGRPELSLGRDIGSSKQVVQPNDVLLSRIVPHIRRAWVVGEHRGHRQIASGEWIVFRSKRIDPSYLRYLLVEDRFHAKFMNTVAGVGGSLMRARPVHVADIEVPLPSLPEQQRIARRLQQADRLRRTRRYALEVTGDFLPAAFVELFGDPTALMRNWQHKPFAELLASELQNGLSPSTAGTVTAKVLTLSAITRGSFDGSASKLGLFNSEPPPAKRVRAADFLICRGNGNLEMVGRGEFPPRDMPDCVYPDTMIAAQVEHNLICRSFLGSVWKTPALRRQIEASARTTNGTHKINQEVLGELEVPVPPLPIQQKFSAIVARLEHLRAAQRETLRQAQHLFASLLHRAFSN